MNEIRLFSTNSDIEFARKVAGKLGIALHEPTEFDEKGQMITWFSNQNVFVDIKVPVRGCHCFVFMTQTPSVSNNLLELWVMINALKSAKADKVTAVMPYMPYIRSDKKDHPRACIGAKLILNILQTVGADGILLLDPHFPQIHGFVDECKVSLDVLWAEPIFVNFIKNHYEMKNVVIVAPDIGEAKHTAPMANRLHLPIAIIDKRRVDDSEDAVASSIVGDIRGKDCFIFDDETASGRTLIQASDFCLKNEARSVSAFITHPVLSNADGLKELVKSQLSRLVVTNSIPLFEKRNVLSAKIEVLDVSEYFAGAIKVIFAGDSLDEYKQNFYKKALC